MFTWIFAVFTVLGLGFVFLMPGRSYKVSGALNAIVFALLTWFVSPSLNLWLLHIWPMLSAHFHI